MYVDFTDVVFNEWMVAGLLPRGTQFPIGTTFESHELRNSTDTNELQQ